MQGEFQHTAAEIRQECRDLVAKTQDNAKAAVKGDRELASDKNKKLQRALEEKEVECERLRKAGIYWRHIFVWLLSKLFLLLFLFWVRDIFLNS